MPIMRHMRMLRAGAVGIAGVLLTGCGQATGCADIGGDPGVQIAADDYTSAATAAHTIEVCVDDDCGTASLDEPFPFITLDDLRAQSEVTVVVVVRDQQEQVVTRTALTAAPALFKPGGEACDFAVARLRLSLGRDRTAQVVNDP